MRPLVKLYFSDVNLATAAAWVAAVAAVAAAVLECVQIFTRRKNN